MGIIGVWLEFTSSLTKMKGKKMPIKVYRLINTKVLLSEYPSIAKAASDLNLDPQNVARVVRGERSRVGEFTFTRI